MAHDRGRRRGMGRREAIALAGLLAGMASAALLAQIVQPPVTMNRTAI